MGDAGARWWADGSAVWAAATLLVLTASCTTPAPPTPQLVILYASCTVNKHYVSPYEPSVPFTPHLERFAREGVVFARHQTESGQSGIAFASLLSGTHADHHGVYRHPLRLRDELELATDERERAFVLAIATVTHGPYAVQPVGRLRDEFPAAAADVSEAGMSRYAPLYPRHHLGLSWNYPATVERLGRDEAYDLARDPGETRNLFDLTSPAHRRARAALARYKERLVEHYDAEAEARAHTMPAPRRREALRNLGYIE